MTDSRKQLIRTAMEKVLGRRELAKFETRAEVIDWIRFEVDPREVVSVLDEHFERFEFFTLESIISKTPPYSADLSKGMLDSILRVFGPVARRRAPEGGALN